MFDIDRDAKTTIPEGTSLHDLIKKAPATESAKLELPVGKTVNNYGDHVESQQKAPNN